MQKRYSMFILNKFVQIVGIVKISIFIIICMVYFLFCEITVYADAVLMDNLNAQYYKNNSYPRYSYLIKTNTGYDRLSMYSVDSNIQTGDVISSYEAGFIGSWKEGINSETLVIESYDENFNFQSTKYIDGELSYFGGFYEGQDAYYLLFGQDNYEQDNSKEIIRIVKYDKNWHRLKEASLCGLNSVSVFGWGGARIAESDGCLFIHTNRTMYKSNDGNNHESNLTFEIEESSMTMLGTPFYGPLLNYAYVSHSMNQFILIDDKKNLITLDHGDAYPRASVLFHYQKKAGTDSFSSYNLFYDSVELLSYYGEDGNNYTGASIGGMEYSDTNYITVGSSVIQDSLYNNRIAKNIYVTVTNRDAFSKEQTTFQWITDYKESDGLKASTPQLVKLSNNSFLLLWAQMENKTYISNDANGKICYVYLDGEGRITGRIHTENGYLSDCQPIVSRNRIVWYVMNNGRITFYSIDEMGNLLSKEATDTISSVQNAHGGLKILWNKRENAEKYCLLRRNDQYANWTVLTYTIETEYLDTEVKKGETYYYTIRSMDKNGNFLGAVFDQIGVSETYEESTDSQVVLKISNITQTSNGIKVQWNSIPGAVQYGLYYGEISTKVYLQTIITNGFTDYVIPYENIKSNVTYNFYVTATDDIQKIYISDTVQYSVTVPAINSDSNNDSSSQKSNIETKKGDTFLYSNIRYQVNKIDVSEKKAYITCIGIASYSGINISVPERFHMDGITYTVTKIGARAFFNDMSMESIVLPNSVTYIGKKSFAGCRKLRKVTIGKRIVLIGDAAFKNSKELKRIVIKTTELTNEKIGKDAFKGICEKVTIKVPKNRLKIYKALLKAKGVGKKAKIKW